MEHISNIISKFKIKEETPEGRNYNHYLKELMTFSEYEIIRDELRTLINYRNIENIREEFFEIKQQNFIFNYIKKFITETDRQAFKEWLLSYDNGAVVVNHKAKPELFQTLLDIKHRYAEKIPLFYEPVQPIQVVIHYIDGQDKFIKKEFEDYDYNRKYMTFKPKELLKDEVPTAYEQPPKRRY